MMKKDLLGEYNKKRDFKKTKEPGGKKKSATKKKGKLTFVVQEHHASHLHYDFRLEWEGVLKSWAVPKGPSQDPADKRLAVETEDHPLEYGKFQGTIPKGEYGGGEVFIWDNGTWEPEGDVDDGFKKGHLQFTLKGKKLKGKWHLVKTHWTKGNGAPKNWLLMKASEKVVKLSSMREVSSPDKILFKKEKITKQEVADFYQSISKHMLPYLENRPLSLVRCPEGSEGSCFFQKHVAGKIPESFKTFPLMENEGEGIYFSINSSQGLRELVQLNAFELHTWNCHYQTAMRPDQIVMDFDPGPAVLWKEVVSAAFELKEMLEELDLKSFVKLTGGKGIHVHIPIAPLYDWEQIKSFSQTLALQMVSQNPEKYVANMSKKLRKGKIFVDYLRNGYGATAVVPYSLRAKPLSAVALPLEWAELKKVKGPQQYTMKKTLRKMKSRKSDPWKGMLKMKQKISILKPLKGHGKVA